MTYEAWKFIVRGYYEVDKFLFTLLLAVKLDMQAGKVRYEEFQTLIKGGAALDLNAVDPKPKKWIPDMVWLNMVALTKLPQYTNVLNSIAQNDKVRSFINYNSPSSSFQIDIYI